MKKPTNQRAYAKRMQRNQTKTMPALVRNRFASAGLKGPFAWFVKALFIGALLLLCYVLLAWYKPIKSAETVFVVEENMTYNQVIENLGAEGHIMSPFWLKVYRKLFLAESLQTGEYDVGDRIAPVALLAAIGGTGKHSMLQLRVIEGKTVAFVRKQLQNDTRIVQTVAQLSDEELLTAIAGDDPGKPPFLEGLFAPNTYYFSRKVKDIQVMQRLYKDQLRILDQAWQQRSPNLLYKNKWELLIMASIVEKESSMVEEQAKIAGVFMTRLRLGMKLQTDPTVIYGMGDAYFGKITRADLLRATPYNTYVIDGLPPTPIALPSKTAIEAAAKPQETGDLFFVATGYGGHMFNKTYDKHQLAVDAYWRLMAERKAAKEAETIQKNTASTANTATLLPELKNETINQDYTYNPGAIGGSPASASPPALPNVVPNQPPLGGSSGYNAPGYSNNTAGASDADANSHNHGNGSQSPQSPAASGSNTSTTDGALPAR